MPDQKHGLSVPHVEILPLPLTGWVASGISSHVSKPQYIYPCNRDKNSTYFVALLSKALRTALSLHQSYSTCPGPDPQASENNSFNK